jgi:hypothetical protein
VKSVFDCHQFEKSFFALCALIVSVIAGFCNPGFAASAEHAGTSDDEALSALNCAIIHKEIELEKSNARFLMNSHPEGRWKAWRYFLFQESGGALIEAGLVTGLADRYRQMDHGGKIRGVLIEDSLIPQMIGQFVAAAGDVVELGLNVRLARRAKREDREVATCKKVAMEMHNDLLKLLDERESLLKNCPNLSTSISKLETRILRGEARLAWLQYSRSLHNARKLAGTENAFYALDILKNLSGAAGNLVGIAATSAVRPKLNIGANVLTTVSGALIMTDPITSRIAGKIIAMKHRKGLDSHFRQELDKVAASLAEDSDAMKRAYEKLDNQNDHLNRILSTRVDLYSNQAERAGRFVATEKAKDRKANTGALNTLAVAGFSGSTKVATGTCGVIAADRLSDHAGASTLLGGTAAYATGTGVALLDNLRINIAHERRYQLQRKTGTSANHVLLREINDLDLLDKQLSMSECADSSE